MLQKFFALFLFFTTLVSTASSATILNRSYSKKTVKIIEGVYSKGKVHFKGKKRRITIKPGGKASYTPGKKCPGVKFIVIHPKKKNNVYTFTSCAHALIKETVITINDYD